MKKRGSVWVPILIIIGILAVGIYVSFFVLDRDLQTGEGTGGNIGGDFEENEHQNFIGECSDGIDNDGDGNIDLVDGQCIDENDNFESDSYE